MMEFQFYLWVLYGIAGLGLLLLFGNWAGKLQSRFFRDALLGLFILVIFTPWFVDPEQPDLAPAVIIALHEWLLSEAADGWRATLPLLWSYGGFLLVLLLCYRLTNKFRPAVQQPDAARESVRDAAEAEANTSVNNP